MSSSQQAQSLMILGTSSSVGKSIITTGLCQLFSSKGLRVAPFKSQNMSNFAYQCRSGGQISSAQAWQARACGLEPSPLMNPILLKPQSDQGSAVYLLGKFWQQLSASEYYKLKHSLWPAVHKAYAELAQQHDLMLVEGAGSPAEINLQQDDFVNLGLAARLNIPCLLVGDIDRGGVFASLYGTLMLLPAEQRHLVKGIIINKFRGDLALLEPGLRQLEELCALPVIGVVPYGKFDLPDEDSLSLAERQAKQQEPSSAQVKLGTATSESNFAAECAKLAALLRTNLNLPLIERIIAQGA